MTEGYVFDTGPLSHFSEGGWLGVLEYLADGRPSCIPEAVERELADAMYQYAFLKSVLDAPWISTNRSDDLVYTLRTAEYESRLVSGSKNRGECAVLALAQTLGWTAVIDDSEAREIAKENGITVVTTLHFLCGGIRTDKISAELCKKVIEVLIRTNYRLPFKSADDFFEWAMRNDMLEPAQLGLD